jgi:hypothetical protein
VHTFDLLMTAVNAGVKDVELWSETGVTLCSMLANMLIKNPGQAAEVSHSLHCTELSLLSFCN